MTQPLSQRVQDAVRDALATTTRNPDASLDTTAAFIASAVLAEVHRQPAAAAAVAPPTNQTALRDRIRLAIARQWLDEMGSDRTVDELDNAEFGEFADAVLAVLPEPVDRTAVLREAISAVRDGDLGPRDGTSRDYENGWWNSRAAAEQRIRSLVDTSTRPVTVVSHRLPMSEQQAEEMNEGSSLIQQWAARAAAEPAAGARQDGAES